MITENDLLLNYAESAFKLGLGMVLTINPEKRHYQITVTKFGNADIQYGTVIGDSLSSTLKNAEKFLVSRAKTLS